MAQDQFEGLAGFRLALRRFLAFSEVATLAAGVTSQQYQAMLVIKTHPEGRIPIKDLADQLLIKHNGAVQLVDRLVSAGMAVRLSAPSDRRSVLVALTSGGEAMLAELAAAQVPELLKHETLLADSLRRLRRIAFPKAG
ncbi:MAG: MarR family transcriptional regulator [Caulobacteraceae bacterium]|nr:MarR family transcriptional regulator [Caulobacteraceae bacterium]